MSDLKRVVILGSTGSVGCSTLSIIQEKPQLQVIGLSAQNNMTLLVKQCLQFQPQFVSVSSKESYDYLQKQTTLSCKILYGEKGLITLAELTTADIVVTGIPGVAGLPSLYAAIKAGKRVLFANKESLICAGKLLMDALRQSHAWMLPIDSEHSAIFQCLDFEAQQSVCRGESVRESLHKVTITASGGALLDYRGNLDDITPEKACQHPTWKMGPKISVDSATMMNKGLEVIEACWLFGLTLPQIDVLIHRQSIVHALVSYEDGTQLAQLAINDMRVPIHYGLFWPKHHGLAIPPLQLTDYPSLSFEHLDESRFSLFQLAKECYQAGGLYCITLNMANEVAVEAFLKANIRFTQIEKIIRKCVESTPVGEPNTLDSVIECCMAAKQQAQEIMQAIC